MIKKIRVNEQSILTEVTFIPTIFKFMQSRHIETTLEKYENLLMIRVMRIAGILVLVIGVIGIIVTIIVAVYVFCRRNAKKVPKSKQGKHI